MSYPASLPAPVASVRRARPEEYPTVGELTVRAYTAAGFLSDDSAYADQLRDSAGRAAGADLLVAVDEDDRILGTATLVLEDASPYAQIARAGEAELRMLAVDPDAQRGGIGQALVEYCVERCVAAARTGIALLSRTDMRAAHRIYERLGFARDPERDWEPMPGFLLVAYALRLPAQDDAATYCDRCGRLMAEGSHEQCAGRRSLEPPRYCAACGRRMVVQVTPRSWTARCVEHGVVAG